MHGPPHIKILLSRIPTHPQTHRTARFPQSLTSGTSLDAVKKSASGYYGIERQGPMVYYPYEVVSLSNGSCRDSNPSFIDS